MTYPLLPLTSPLWRMVDPRRHLQPFSEEGARLYGGRWNLKGWPALYLATDHLTAMMEYNRELVRPGTLVPFNVTATAIANLTDGRGGPADARVAEALTEDWKIIARIDGQVPLGWALAQELIGAGAEGALVPSVQNRGGTNIVLWRWHIASQNGEGATLTLLDPEGALTP